MAVKIITKAPRKLNKTKQSSYIIFGQVHGRQTDSHTNPMNLNRGNNKFEFFLPCREEF